MRRQFDLVRVADDEHIAKTKRPADKIAALTAVLASERKEGEMLLMIIADLEDIVRRQNSMLRDIGENAPTPVDRPITH